MQRMKAHALPPIVEVLLFNEVEVFDFAGPYEVISARRRTHYEGLYCLSMESFVRDHPQDPDAAPFRERIRAWRDAYRRWGRDTLGFGYYLFCKPR